MRRKKYLLWVPLILATVGIVSCSSGDPIGGNTDATVETADANVAPFDYSDYETVLATYVTADGMVDYAGLSGDRAALDRFAAALGNVTPATYSTWSEAERLAFLINAYNALTLVSIIDEYPVESIRNISGVWKGRKFSVVGQDTTLDNIEHGTIRTQFSEPRIHFAVNCASVGCPILRNEPFTGDDLEAQLEEQTAISFASPAHFQIDRDRKEIYLSSVFKWFGKDWEPGYALEEALPGLSERETAFANFASQYVSDADKEFLLQGGYKVKFTDWDWSLNSQGS